MFLSPLNTLRSLQLWPRKLLKKWLSFQETGDDFDRDSDSSGGECSESEDFEDSDSKSILIATRPLLVASL